MSEYLNVEWKLSVLILQLGSAVSFQLGESWVEANSTRLRHEIECRATL